MKSRANIKLQRAKDSKHMWNLKYSEVMHNSSHVIPSCQVSSIVIENRKKIPQRDFKRMFGPLERERESK